MKGLTYSFAARTAAVFLMFFTAMAACFAGAASRSGSVLPPARSIRSAPRRRGLRSAPLCRWSAVR